MSRYFRGERGDALPAFIDIPTAVLGHFSPSVAGKVTLFAQGFCKATERAALLY